MTREEAIQILDPATTAEALAEIEYYAAFRGEEAVRKAVDDACVLAVSALQEQEERERGCEYCQQFDDPCSAPMIAAEESDVDRGIYLYNNFLCANGGEFCEAEINFCPMCGRRLHLPKPTAQKSNN